MIKCPKCEHEFEDEQFEYYKGCLASAIERQKDKIKKREDFEQNYIKEIKEQHQRQALGKKEFRFDILRNTGCMPNGDFLNTLYEDYWDRVEEYRKTHGNNADLTDVPLIMEI